MEKYWHTKCHVRFFFICVDVSAATSSEHHKLIEVNPCCRDNGTCMLFVLQWTVGDWPGLPHNVPEPMDVAENERLHPQGLEEMEINASKLPIHAPNTSDKMLKL